MYKSIYILLILLLSQSRIFAAQPIVKVEPLPSGNELEIYEDSENLFAMKILEYYKLSIALETQIRIMGLESATRVISPTLEELEDTDIRTLRKFYRQATALEKQVIDAPEGLFNAKIDDLRLKLDKQQYDNFILKEQLFVQNLDLLSCNFYKTNYRKLIAQSDSIRLVIDENYFDYMQKLWGQNLSLHKLHQNTHHYTPILSLSGTGNFLNFRNNNIESDISPGVMITFNPSPIIGFGKFVDIFGEYIHPILLVVEENSSIRARYNTNMLTTGLKLNVPLSDLMKINDFQLDFKAGYGFFWANTEAPNTDFGRTNWQGQLIRLELGVSNFNKIFFPVGVFINYNFYNFSKDLKFASYDDNVNFGKHWVNNLQLGLKFTMWHSSMILH